MSESNTNKISSFQNNPKDQKISELRSKLDSLKKCSKDFKSLNSQYEQLLNDYSLINEAKLRLEYEIRQRESEYNRRISDLKAENETLKLGLNDKMTNSKKIFSENDAMGREIELKNEEIINLNEKLNNITNAYEEHCQNKNYLVDIVQNIHEEILLKNEQLNKLKEDNIYLKNIYQENEKCLHLSEDDIHNLSKQINEHNYNMQNLNKKIILNENNINNLKKKINSYNEINLGLGNILKEMEKEVNDCRKENDLLKNELLNERNMRIDIENNNERLKNIIIQNERQLNQINNENEYLKIVNTQYKKNKDFINIQNNQLKNQAFTLENQNNILIKEIDNILAEDKRKKEIISRKERINYLLKNNNDSIGKSVYDLDMYINKYGNNYNTERFTYHYYDYEPNF